MEYQFKWWQGGLKRMNALSYTRIIIETIKNWMKRHAGEIPPGQKEMLKNETFPEGFVYNYSVCKKQAYKELEKEGYILKKNSPSCQAVIDYKVPEGIGKKIVDKLIPDPVVDQAEATGQEDQTTQAKDKSQYHLGEKPKAPRQNRAVKWKQTPVIKGEPVEAFTGKKPEKAARDTDNDQSIVDKTHIYISKQLQAKELKGIGRMIYNMGRVSPESLLTVQIRITQ